MYHSTERNASESPLLRLPPELRSRIYRYALNNRTLRPFNNASDYASMHNLPLACRQLYVESHLEVYRCGTFHAMDAGQFHEFIYGRYDLLERLAIMSSITAINVSAASVNFARNGLAYGRNFVSPTKRDHQRPHLVINLLFDDSGSFYDHRRALENAVLIFNRFDAELRFVVPGSEETRSILMSSDVLNNVWKDSKRWLR